MINSIADKFYSEFLFRQCIKEKFHKAFLDYGLFLYSEEKYTDALQILKEGMDLGNFRCNFIYYDLFLSLLNFEKDFHKLIDLSEVLVADILIGNVFSVFDFFFKRKILIKNFKIPIEKLYNENISDLLEITSKSITDKEMIINNFAGNIVFTELLLSHGFLNYIGASGKTDYKLAEKCLKESFETSGNNSYKRFCYSYLFKIRMRRLGFKKQKVYGDMIGDYYCEKYEENEQQRNMLEFDDYNKINCKQINLEENKKDENNVNLFISINNNDLSNAYNSTASNNNNNNAKIENYISKDQEKALEEKIIIYDDKEIFIGTKISKTKKKLFKIYNDSINEGNLQDFSSSYFYFMGKIFENGWGCKKDVITAYCYYLHGKDAKIKSLGTGSVISYYRRFKSLKKLESEKYKNTISSIENVKNLIILGLEEKECFICFENEKNTVLFPCQHMMCFGCYNQIKETARCPTCRTKILLVR